MQFYQLLLIIAFLFVGPFALPLVWLNPYLSKRNKLRNSVLPALYELANKHDEDGNTFVESLSSIYAVLENIERDEQYL